MSFTMETDIAVVGAGPAGLSAALAATNAGARVVVLDEYPEPGGQFYKQLPAEFSVPDRTKLDEDYTKGDAVLAEVKKAGVTMLLDAPAAERKKTGPEEIAAPLDP